MRKIIIITVVIIIVAIVFFIINKFQAQNVQQGIKKQFNSQLINSSNNMKISSTAFENNGNIPKKYTCDGMGINPSLTISDVPQDTLSLALIMDDPDAPVPGGFVHWVIFNLDPQTREIKENSTPTSGIEGTGSSEKQGYVSPCPPSGTHHYQFKLYALDEILKLDSLAKKADVEKAMAGHIIEQTLLVGLYQRQ
jgi:Raf kinase inhibitor-like YbhB/YbcL family protein